MPIIENNSISLCVETHRYDIYSTMSDNPDNSIFGAVPQQKEDMVDYIKRIKELLNKPKDRTDKENLDSVSEATLRYIKEKESNSNINNTNYELEMTVHPIPTQSLGTGGNRKNSQYTSSDIRTITEHLMRAGYVRQGDPSTFLRVSRFVPSDQRQQGMPDTYAQLNKLNNVRICIAQDSIQSFCKMNKNENFGSDFYQNDSVHFERKRNILKFKSKSYNNVNIKLSEETDISNPVKRALKHINSKTNNVIADVIKDSSWNSMEKKFRYINRVTFVLKENKNGKDNKSKSCARVDISTVYETEGSYWSGIDPSKDTPKYEVEIEAVNKEGCNKEHLISSLLHALKAVLCGQQDSCFPITTESMENVRNAYVGDSKTLLSTKDNNKSWLPWFKGPQPVTLQKEDVSGVCNGHDYNVTNKSDGLRKLLYIFDDKLYLLDSSRRIQYTGVSLSKEADDEEDESSLNGTILDGELVQLKIGNVTEYQVFDMYSKGGKTMLDKVFSVRQKEFKAVIKEIDRVKDSYSVSSSLKFLSKEFEHVDEQGISNIQRIIKENESKFDNDGMILTPTGPVPGTKSNNKNVYKWKTEEDTTIDFRVKVIKEEYNYSSNGYAGGDNKQALCALYVATDNESIENPCNYLYFGNLPSKGPDQVGRDRYNTRKLETQFKYLGDDETMSDVGFATFSIINNKFMKTENNEYNEFFTDGDIVECRYNKRENVTRNNRWQAIRVRRDKTSPNFVETANNNFKFIMNPVNIEKDLCKGDEGKEGEGATNKNEYYTKNNERSTRQIFHNKIKQELIRKAATLANNSKGSKGSTRSANADILLIDYGVGKGGDLMKWKDSGISFVYGIDYSKSNLNNSYDGACARYLNMKMNNKTNPMPLTCMFAVGDCSKSIENGDAFREGDDSGTEQTMSEIVNKSVFAQVKADEISEALKGIKGVYGKGKNGFDIGSSQFSMHYFFESQFTINQFIKNLQFTIKKGGYFVGTCFDGQKVLELLTEGGDDDSLMNNNFREVKYDNTRLKFDNEVTESKGKDYWVEKFKSELGGIRLKVSDTGFDDQIEYLVNFELFDKEMKKNGFVCVERVNFSEKYASKKYKNQFNMSDDEKEISKMNTTFIYKYDGVKDREAASFETVPLSMSKQEKEKDTKSQEGKTDDDSSEEEDI